MDRERAVSSIIGVVMILGITLAAMTAVLVLGSVAMQTTQDDARLSQMETSMAEMSSKASLSALGDSGSQQFDFGELDAGSMTIDPDAGNVSITYADNSSSENQTEIYNETSLGALVYQYDDHEVAFQGGGVWKQSGNDGGTMISPPEYHYQAETLTFPIIRIDGDDRTGGQVSGSIQREPVQTIFPNKTTDKNFTNPVEDMSIFVEIESEYHRGWYEFFDSRSEGEVYHDPDNQTVRKELTVPFDESFDNAVASVGDISGTDNIHGEYDENQYRQSASPLIEQKVEAHADEYDNFAGDGTYSNESYFADGDRSIENDATFDTTNNDINVTVNGTLEITGDVEIKGDNNVTFYLREGFELGGGDPTINNASADQLAVFVHSDVDEIDSAANFNGVMRGLIYAPGSHLDWKGNSDFHGTLVVGSADLGGNVDVYYDESFEFYDLPLPTDQDVLRYLHITDNRIHVEFD